MSNLEQIPREMLPGFLRKGGGVEVSAAGQVSLALGCYTVPSPLVFAFLCSSIPSLVDFLLQVTLTEQGKAASPYLNNSFRYHIKYQQHNREACPVAAGSWSRSGSFGPLTTLGGPSCSLLLPPSSARGFRGTSAFQLHAMQITAHVSKFAESWMKMIGQGKKSPALCTSMASCEV